MIVITAPTGNIGRALLPLLLDSAHGEPLRVVVRDPARLPEEVRGRTEVVTGSHGDPEVVDRAFEGADAVFWLVPPDATRTPDDGFSGFSRPAAKALAAHGVGHVVGVSALGRGTPVAGRAGLVTASLALDDLLAGTGAAYRALANASFYENLLEDADTIRSTGAFTDVTAADRKAPFVAVADIAAVAADLLLNRSWSGVDSVPVLGPEDLSPNDLARIMTARLGRTVRYVRQSYEDLLTDLLGYGLNEEFARGVVAMKCAKDEGLDAGAARTPATSTPTTFAQWCTDTLAPALLPTPKGTHDAH
ncbi:NAD(P)H-binding protein [Streptomyces sp. NPDC087440]|uniref:NAD(P)H-binding protein n=1 Tax=Streptomyces sp. NPDC087440 TaxID=3365790 RepID=UPI003820F847